MDPKIKNALATDGLIDITTMGRKSGKPSRIEIAFHNFDGTIYLSGRPGKRDWYANLVANPEFTFHLKQSAQADIPAHATPITTEPERTAVMTKIIEKWNRQAESDSYLKHSPLVRVKLQDAQGD